MAVKKAAEGMAAPSEGCQGRWKRAVSTRIRSDSLKEKGGGTGWEECVLTSH